VAIGTDYGTAWATSSDGQRLAWVEKVILATLIQLQQR